MKTILLILLLFANIKCKEESHFEEEEIQKICSKCRKDFNDTYRNQELLDSISENDTINDYVIKIVKMIETEFNSSELIDDYVTPRIIYPNVIYIVLMVFVILLWIALIVLACLNKKVFKFKNNKDELHLQNHILAYITVSILLVTLIISSILISYIYKAQTYFNGSMCAILRIYLDIRDGDLANTTYWRGIKNLQEDLVGGRSVVNNLISKIELQENIANYLEENKFESNSFADYEKNNDNYFYSKEVPSPNTLDSTVYPKYSRNRHESIEQIQLEYDFKLKEGVTDNEQIRDLNKYIKENPELINGDYLFISNKLNEILETVQIVAEEYLQYLIDYTKYANNIIFPILYAIFSLSIIFSFLGIIFILLYIKDKNISLKLKKIFSVILHIIWNIILFLLLFTCISQIVFKIFEIFGEDGSGLVQYILSEDNFESSDSIILKGGGKVFLETCFNDENGDLFSKIISKMDQANSMFDKLNKTFLQEIIIAAKYQIYQKVELNGTQSIIEGLEDNYNDYSTIYYYQNLIDLEKCQNDFDDLNQYTDYSNPLASMQYDLSDKHTYDMWASKKENCDKGYTYINNANDREEGDKNKYCMVLGEINKETSSNFYSGIKTKNILSNKDIKEIFGDYYKCLLDFKDENQKLLKEDPNFIGMTQGYYNELINIKEKILEGIQLSKEITVLIYEILGNGSAKSFGFDLFTIMNCQFLKRDVKVFYYEMKELRENSKPYLIIAVFVFIFLLVSAILIIINIYKYQKNDNNGNIEKKESNASINLD